MLWNEKEGAYDGALFGPGSKMVRNFTGPLAYGHYATHRPGESFSPCMRGVVPPERKAQVRQWILNHLDQVLETHVELLSLSHAVRHGER